MRVLVTGSHERVSRLEPVLKEGGWEVVSATRAGEVAGAAEGIDAAVVLPTDIEFQTGSCTSRLVEFLEAGLLERLRILSGITEALAGRGGVRFVLVGGNVPPSEIPDNQSARAGLMAAAAKAAVADGGEGCSAKVLGPTCTDLDILAALTPTGRTPMVVWDLPSQDESLSFGSWRDAVMTGR